MRGGPQLLLDLLVQRVHRRPVEPDGADRAFDLESDEFTDGCSFWWGVDLICLVWSGGGVFASPAWKGRGMAGWFRLRLTGVDVAGRLWRLRLCSVGWSGGAVWGIRSGRSEGA
jgi:hypothetical protein